MSAGRVLGAALCRQVRACTFHAGTMAQMHQQPDPKREVSRMAVPTPGAQRGLSHLEGEVVKAAAVGVRVEEVDDVPAPAEAEPAAFDDSSNEYELYPHSWEKAIQSGLAVPSDEFHRKNFILSAWKPHPHTNLFTQIIVQALEEARAVDLVVVDVSNKFYYFPNHHDHFSNDVVGQRKIDTKIYCSGKTAKHIEMIAWALADKIQKGLVPGEFSASRLKVDTTMEEVFWFLTVPCGQIMVEVAHPMRRQWRMRERRDICMKVADSNMFVEDMLADGGWVKLWDHWTPVSASMPENEHEYVYTQERSHGWERIDVLKPQYCVTLQDEQRRAPAGVDPLVIDRVDLENPTAADREFIREQLRERKVLLSGGGSVQLSPETEKELADQRAAEIAAGTMFSNIEWKESDTATLVVSDEEVDAWLDRMREDMRHRPMVYESAEDRARKDAEWADYMRRREARIRRFGYYDWVELQNDMHRGVVVLPDGPYEWDSSRPPDFVIEPHPENYKGKPRDTHWGPGWYDV
eukprot:TRINITY_DN14704_c0_g1_i1.p1 TRINITY_DN14704_c0_g1~~TRINITY_DN14704_c0_g1_i1.p1  ORF type:complete len:521 (+),score=196.73 TRINITY_DN14704_c0_g1_i1:95-1657(+)